MGRLVCIVGNWHFYISVPTTSSILDRHDEMGTRFSGKVTFSGGRACSSREIGYSRESVIKGLVSISVFTCMLIFEFPTIKRGLSELILPPRSVNLALLLNCLHLPLTKRRVAQYSRVTGFILQESPTYFPPVQYFWMLFELENVCRVFKLSTSS